MRNGKLLFDNILVKPIEEESDGLIAKSVQYEDKAEIGEVLLVGEGRLLDNGTFVKMRVQVGDTIFFQKYGATKVRGESEDLLIIKEEDVYEILKG